MEGKSLEAIVAEPNNTRDAILMALKSPYGERTTWVIVEAEEDYKVYSKFMLPDTTTVKTSKDRDGRKGYSHVESIVKDIKKEVSHAHIFGIRDADYTRYEDQEHIFPLNIFITDQRDLEMMMLSSNSVKEGLCSWAQEFEEALNQCADVCRYFGYLRIFNHVKQLGCTFHDTIEIRQYWSDKCHSLKNNWKEDCTGKFICHVNTSLASEDLDNFIKEKNLDQESFFNICRGHDFLSIISRVLIHTNIYTPTTIMAHMIRSYQIDDFKTTLLYANIVKWQTEENVTALAS